MNHKEIKLITLNQLQRKLHEKIQQLYNHDFYRRKTYLLIKEWDHSWYLKHILNEELTVNRHILDLGINENKLLDANIIDLSDGCVIDIADIFEED